MKYANSYKWLDLDHDLPTNREDILALRRARELRPSSFAAYLEFLANFAPPPMSVLRARRGPAGTEPFTL